MKIVYKLLVLNVLIAIFILNSCIDPFEFERIEPAELLVVRGQFTTTQSEHRLQIGTSGEYKRAAFVPESGALVELFAGDGSSAIYEEREAGDYYLTANSIRAVIGQSYFIKISLTDGRVYQSTPAILPAPVALDRIFFTIEDGFSANSLGVVLTKQFVNVGIEMTPPSREDGPFIKWDTENVYIFIDLSCEPMDPSRDCYITDFPNAQDVFLYDGSNSIGGQLFQKTILVKRIDETHNYRQYYSVYQKSITKDAHRYWSQVDQIVNQVGSIFDVPPAPVRGNIFNPEDRDEIVLGYFEISSADTLRITSDARSIPFQQRGTARCGNVFRRPDPLPAGCCECLTLENSTDVVPDYW
ncbi:MAG: DUF4249 domain-containing protein [Saprospiraceae bacterium]